MMERFPQIFKVILITQPEEKKSIKIAAPLQENKGMDSILFEHYGESPYFALVEIQEEGDIVSFEILSNEFLNEEKRKGILISDWLNSKNIDKLYVKKELKKGPMLIFKNNAVRVQVTDFENITQIIEKEKKLFHV